LKQLITKRRLIIGGIIAGVLVLTVGAFAAGAYIFTVPQSGSINIVPTGNIAVTMDTSFGNVVVGSVVAKSVKVENLSNAPVIISAEGLKDADGDLIATLSWPLAGQTLEASAMQTVSANFTVVLPNHWGTQTANWAVVATTP
jgi:hypothetical protein